MPMALSQPNPGLPSEMAVLAGTCPTGPAGGTDLTDRRFGAPVGQAVP